jgi:hypothetical protein
MSEEEFEQAWFDAREYVSRKLAEWDVEIDDLEVQGLQTVYFGFEQMRSFANSVGADLSELPGTDELDDALRYVADVEGDGRETHIDQFASLCQRAAVADYLEKDTHYGVVREGKPGEELRVNVTQAFDEVSKYVRDHDLNEDLLGSAKDYKDRFGEAVEQDTYVTTTSQGTPGVGRAVGIHTGRASEELAEFNRSAFLSDEDDRQIVADLAHDEDDDGDDDRDSKSLAEINEDDVGNSVAVTDVAFTGWRVLEDSEAFAVGTLSSAADDDVEVNVIAFDPPRGGTPEPPEYIEIQDAKIGTYDGELQVQVDARTSIHMVERAEDQQTSVEDASATAVEADGGKILKDHNLPGAARAYVERHSEQSATAIIAKSDNGLDPDDRPAVEALLAEVRGNDEESVEVDRETVEKEILDTVEYMGAMKDVSAGARVDRVVGKVAGKTDATIEYVEHVVGVLKRRGDLYEPAKGRLRTT